ncbi:PAS domain-containing protein [Seohaeicola saemankumensis]|nr:ATP-binding protein [Seohaeicola saemankumensis]MCA0869546.1 PAS domain-containing protein [Seohaeicola saemankumensis]
MAQEQDAITAGLGRDVGDKVWVDVLEAVDKTYAELVDYQEQLEARNAELTTLRDFLGSIMSSISDYLVVADKSGTIADASVSFCEALGLPKPDLVGQPLLGLFDGAHRTHLSDTISLCQSGRQRATVEVELTTAQGAEPVEFRLSPRLDRRRKSTGVVLAGRPLGELRRAYSELEESHEELKQAQGQLVRNEKLASLGRLLAGVAHELNNPISFVYANTHSLEKYLDRFETYFEKVQMGASREELIALRQELRLERDLKNLRAAIEGARDGSERVRNIVEDLRRLSAEGSGEMASFDLTETARVAANWIERGSKSGVTITFDGEPACLAHGRSGHIQQVLMNLVQNAVDAMAGQPDPQIAVRLAYHREMAVLDLCDNGPGVPPEVAPTIFDPFFTTKDVGQGTGLGLSISHKIVEEHGGRLELVERDGPGACFRLTLKRGDSR